MDPLKNQNFYRFHISRLWELPYLSQYTLTSLKNLRIINTDRLHMHNAASGSELNIVGVVAHSILRAKYLHPILVYPEE